MIDPVLHCPPGLEYNDAEHTYLLDGNRVPGVSSVIRVLAPDQYAMIAEDILMRASIRGKNRHEMVALDVRDDLDMASLPDDMLDAYLAWDSFRNDTGFDVTLSERCVASRKLQVAGTLDLAGKLQWKGSRDLWTVDLKFVSAEPKLVDIQTEGYRTLLAEELPEYAESRRGCLWIRGDKYRFIECNNKGDRALFSAARSIYNWRQHNGY